MTTKNGSSRNATQYGIFSNILLSNKAMGEQENNYLALLAGLRRTFRPANPLGVVLIEKLAFLYLRLSRLYKADIDSAPKLFEKVDEALDDDEPRIEKEHVGANKEYRVIVLPKGPSPELLIRYEANIERQISRTLDQLGWAQKLNQSAPELSGGIAGTDAQ